MKKQHRVILGVVLAALIAPATLLAGIVGSPHDFSGASWNITPSDPSSVCGPCHQPHHADSTVVPLWGHTTISGVAWIMYNTNNVPVSKMKANPQPSPKGASLACLSCHDGTVAVNSYGGTIQGGNPYYITNSAQIEPGHDLTHTHPISFTYDANLVGNSPTQDKWLFNPDSTPVLTPDSGTFNPGNDMSISGFLLNRNHQLECSSCHDVHNQVGTPFDITTNPKLVKIVGTQSGKGSLLCRSCHNK